MVVVLHHDVKHTQGVQRQVKVSPVVLVFWPVAIGTNLSKEESDSLVRSGFKFVDLSTPSRNIKTIPTVSTTGEGSSSRKRKWRHGISKEAQKRLESAASMVATFLQENVESERHSVFQILTENCYDVHLKEEPSFTCLDFQKRDEKNHIGLQSKE